jgi:diketogulonate reductase-like aldo/keto reductase
VSNFDTADMEELWAVPEGRRCATNQVLYHLGERGIEWALLPWMRAHRMPLMAYCPLGEGRLLADRRLATLAARLGAGTAEVALGWLIRQGDVIAIPQSSDPQHLTANRAATTVRFDAAALASVDAAFPPPDGASPLAIV